MMRKCCTLPTETGPAAARQANKRRLVMLMGTARSGTTWLGNILNSSPQSLYSHEPLLRFPNPKLQPLLQQIKETGRLSHAEREEVIDYFSRAYYAMRRPPFFAKDFTAWPAKAVWAAWLAVRASGRGYRAFEYLFSPRRDACYDLIVKQGGLALHGKNFVQALTPEALVIIMRHPCAVIASVRRGQKLGLMGTGRRSQWLDDHEQLCAEYGYARSQLAAMSPAEFEALCWLVENSVYLKLLQSHKNGRLVVYCDLCADPLAATKSTYDALGWAVTEQTLDFLHDTSARRNNRLTSLATASHDYFSVYRPRKESVNGWKDELSRREQEEILAVSQPLLERFWPNPVDEVSAV